MFKFHSFFIVIVLNKVYYFFVFRFKLNLAQFSHVAILSAVNGSLADAIFS